MSRALDGLLSAFSAEGRALIEGGARERRTAAGQHIFEQDVDADGVYLVEAGVVEIWLKKGEREWQLATLGPGAVLGEMSVLSPDHRRHAGARAGGQGATLQHVSLALVRELRDRFPRDYATGVRTLAGHATERLDAANHKLIERLAAERAESMRRDLVVHDLRSPLASIDSGVQALLQKGELYGPLTNKQRSALVRIGKNAAYLRLLVDSILEVERARSAKSDLRATSLQEVLTAIAAPLLSLVAPERWLQLGEDALVDELRGTRLELPGHKELAVSVRADPLRLGQVLLNLVGNAVRYTEGPVQLGLARDGQNVAIFVADRGAGIPAEKRESIFDAFKQRELQDGGLPTGKGFGLAGVREMVTSMGGTISVGDRDDGQRGARFRVLLPAGSAA